MIYIVSHKEVELPEMAGYQPIQVGMSWEDFPGSVRDNTGDQIAVKNPNYCELTALYWIWKNTQDGYKGLVHYRRFFGKSRMSSRPDNIYSADQLAAFLNEGYDMVAAQPVKYHVNAKEQLLMESTTPEIYKALAKIIRTRHPHCIGAFRSFFAQNQASQYNMLFARREVFDTYCEWLFDILFALEEVTDLSGLGDYQQRTYGFLGERLLNVWIRFQDLEVKYVPVVQTENTAFDNWQSLRRDWTNQLRYWFRNK